MRLTTKFNAVFWLITLLTAVFLGILYGYSGVQDILSNGRDLVQDYIASNRLLQGRDIYGIFSDIEVLSIGLKSSKIMNSAGNAHTPTSALLYIPFSIWSFETSAILWTIFSIALLWICMVVIFLKLYPNLDSLYVVVSLMMLLMWGPVFENLHYGNWSIILLSLYLFALICLLHRRECLAGVIIGIAVAIKIYPALLLGLLAVRRRYLSVVAGVITVVLLFVADFDNWKTFLIHVAPANYESYAINYFNGSLFNLGHRIFSGTDRTAPVVYIPQLVLPLNISLSALIILLVAHKLLLRNTPHDLIKEFCLILIVMNLLSPLVWNHYLVFTLLPITYVYSNTQGTSIIAKLAIVLSLPPWNPILDHLHSVDKVSWIFGIAPPTTICLILWFVALLYESSKTVCGGLGASDNFQLPPQLCADTSNRSPSWKLPGRW